MDFYDVTVPVFTRMLHNFETWIDKGVELATAKKFDPDRLLGFRLAPDMYDLVKQVQAACDQAKFACAYLTGKTPPVHPDEEKTIAETKARLRSVISYLETFTRDDFKGTADRKVTPKWAGGKHFTASDFVTQVALPNFLFHCTVGYGILRHNGVELGKQTFLGAVNLRD
jgi:hypothetical protein